MFGVKIYLCVEFQVWMIVDFLLFSLLLYIWMVRYIFMIVVVQFLVKEIDFSFLIDLGFFKIGVKVNIYDFYLNTQ